jgi:hypothetical protein
MLPQSLRSRSLLALATAVSLSITLTINQVLGDQKADPIPTGGVLPKDQAGVLVPEGTRLVSQRVQCRMTGDRLVLRFAADSHPLENRELLATENMAAERLAEQLQADSNNLEWVVSGVVTQYRGQNYFQIQHTVRYATSIEPSKRK